MIICFLEGVSMDMKDYMSTRVIDQIKWYNKKSGYCQCWYKSMQIITIILAAIIPLLSGFVTDNKIIALIVGLMGVVITILESIQKLNKYHEKWIQYRTTSELLKYNKYLYETKSSPYNDNEDTIDNLFVNNIEKIISSENNQWKAFSLKKQSDQDD